MKIDQNTVLGVVYNELEMVQAENALKLTQILDLEIILYNTRQIEMDDGSPCWCGNDGIRIPHGDFCIKARQATEHFWRY